MVDEAKAFCPGCGNALVEEEGPKTTAFQKLDHTVQFGQTMYTQMLEDMGLNISEASAPKEARVEVIKPLETEVIGTSLNASDAAAVRTPKKIIDKQIRSGNLMMYILGGLAILILLPIAVASAVIFFRYLVALMSSK